MSASNPILYSFRRCPYAMRARLAISSAGVKCELREIILRDKAPEFLAASPKGTVPVLITPDNIVIEESFDIILWALEQSDPEGLLARNSEEQADFDQLIANNDGPFKSVLDRYKYASRHEDIEPESEREKAYPTLNDLNQRLEGHSFLMGDKPRLVDIAILPFIRQFAHVDRDWFYAGEWKNVINWLDVFKNSDRFSSIMKKYPKWVLGDSVTLFGGST